MMSLSIMLIIGTPTANQEGLKAQSKPLLPRATYTFFNHQVAIPAATKSHPSFPTMWINLLFGNLKGLKALCMGMFAFPRRMAIAMII